MLNATGAGFEIKILSVLLSFLFLNCSKQNVSLPAALQKITEEQNCECKPFIDEYTLDGNIIYLYICRGVACDCFSTYYDSSGNEFTLRAGQSPVYHKHVWSCK